MDEVYISGALTAIADGARARVFYELLAEIVSECGLRPYLPHHATDPVAAPDLDPRSVYEIDRARVARSGLIVAYAGTPSFGVGIEVEIARERGIPVILVAERDRTVSRILLDILERSFADVARTLGVDPRAVRRRVEEARVRLQLAADAEAAVVGQWLVTELIAPPTRALQLRLFAAQRENDEQRSAEAEDHRQAGLAVE